MKQTIKKISRIPDGYYHATDYPFLALQGKKLKEVGFNIGEYVQVRFYEKCIVIRPIEYTPPLLQPKTRPLPCKLPACEKAKSNLLIRKEIKAYLACNKIPIDIIHCAVCDKLSVLKTRKETTYEIRNSK